MSIRYKILGKPGRDNALFIWLNSGTQMYRILFDCGENIFQGMKQSDIKGIDYLFFSHLHVDHVAGFDYYFRRNFDREAPNYIWGPDDTSEIIHNRLKGYKWNLTENSPGEFIITDITNEFLLVTRFITKEGFKTAHPENQEQVNSSEGIIELINNDSFVIKTAKLNHSITSAGYAIYEKESYNISKKELEKSGLTAGSWLEKIRDIHITGQTEIEVDNKIFKIGMLREKLLQITPGESITYLTDFVLDETSSKNAIALSEGSDTIICESQYHGADFELAVKNFHLTANQAAGIAKDAGAKKLILFHISERYMADYDYMRLLDEARLIFPETYFPEGWEK